VHYYENFGLKVVQENFKGQPALGLYTDTHTHRWGRVLQGGEKKRLQWMTFGIYQEDLEPFRHHLKKCGVELMDSLDPESPKSQSIWFKHPDGLPLQIRVAEKTSPSDAFERAFPPALADHGRAPNGAMVPVIRPAHLSHVLMFTPHVNQSEAFYKEVLGLRL
jgi:hypothetical protein